MATDAELFEQLNKLRGTKTVIVGIGHPLKGDDRAGPLVCQQLQGAKISAGLINAGSVPENHIQPIVKKAPKNLLIIDAIDSGASAGTISIFKPEQLNSFVFSTHTLSPRLFADMIRQAIETDVYFVGIQPAQTQLGRSLSAQVSRAVRSLTDTLVEIFPPAK